MEMNKRMIAIPLAATLCAAAYASIEPLSLDGEWRLDYWPQPEHGAIRTLDIPAHETAAATVPGNCAPGSRLKV